MAGKGIGMPCIAFETHPSIQHHASSIHIHIINTTPLQAGGKLERVAACTALCNLAFSPQYQHYNTVLVSNIVLEPLLQLLQGSCLPQQRSAARMLKALASGTQRVRGVWELWCRTHIGFVQMHLPHPLCGTLTRGTVAMPHCRIFGV